MVSHSNPSHLHVIGSKSPGKQPAKKKTKKSSEQGKYVLPELTPWPEIDLSNITAVTNEILGRVSERDYQDLFSVPVAEAHPEVADAYAAHIDQPIDLRTIEEEQIHVYNSITMLQDDLVLMYQNCCTFNGPGTLYWEYARERWEELNDVFQEVCNDLGVLLPRRWNA